MWHRKMLSKKRRNIPLYNKSVAEKKKRSHRQSGWLGSSYSKYLRLFRGKVRRMQRIGWNVVLFNITKSLFVYLLFFVDRQGNLTRKTISHSCLVSWQNMWELPFVLRQWSIPMDIKQVFMSTESLLQSHIVIVGQGYRRSFACRATSIVL
jgi:hypothetical protein